MRSLVIPAAPAITAVMLWRGGTPRATKAVAPQNHRIKRISLAKLLHSRAALFSDAKYLLHQADWLASHCCTDS